MTKRKVMVVTATRAEYGLLKNTIKAIEKSDYLQLILIVTGMHMSKQYGETWREIEEDGFSIDEKISIIAKDRNHLEEMAVLQIELSKIFQKYKPDILLLLGDRYEILAAASAAVVMKVPIAHISGGESTEGAMDEQIRHAITKMAHIHFPGAKEYGENIRKMGEEEWRIHLVGDPGIENIKKTDFMSQEDVLNDIGVMVDEKTLLITFHPVTLEVEKTEYYMSQLISALDKYDGNMIITYPNSDPGNEIIISMWNEFADCHPNVYLTKSLGIRRYLSVMKLCGAVVGNSSSAIVEAPFFKIPVVNIGNRQLGRMLANNIIETNYDKESINSAINKCLSKEFREYVKDTKSMYGEGNTSQEIVKVLQTISIDEKLMKKKLCY